MTIPEVPIAKNVSMPGIGLGLWQNKNPDAVNAAIQAAYEVGYRHFDSAQAYGNEGYVADGLAKNGIKRSDVFITTKIGVQNFTRVEKSLTRSLQQLKTDHVDLLLLHFPVTLVRKSAWKHLEAIHAAGGARSIGVSNYTIRHLEELFSYAKVMPAVNQVELHVYLQQPELLAFCAQHRIVVEAYSPLAHGHGLDNAVLAQLAGKHNKTPAQIMIRWCIEQGTVPLPKSVNPERIRENVAVFDFAFDDDDIAALQALDQNQRTCWDPTHIP